jgi:hypothetical protein
MGEKNIKSCSRDGFFLFLRHGTIAHFSSQKSNRSGLSCSSDSPYCCTNGGSLKTECFRSAILSAQSKKKRKKKRGGSVRREAVRDQISGFRKDSGMIFEIF